MGNMRKPLAEEVHARLHRMIVDGEIPQGARLVEAQIAKDLDVSRAPVREAVNRLIQDGLLESRQYQGPTVVQLTLQKIKWLYDLRVAVECVAVREVTRRARKADVRLLRLSVADIRKHARRGDLKAVAEAESNFHDTLCQLSENPYVQSVNASLSALVRMALVLDNAAYANPELIAEEHEPVIAAIESGNEGVAVSAISDHILSSLSNFQLRPPAGTSGK